MKKLIILLLISLIFVSCKKNKTPDSLKAKWIKRAFETIHSGQFPQIRAVSWWNENFPPVYLRIDSSPESLEAYRNGINNDLFISHLNFDNNLKLIPVQDKIYHSAFPDFGGPEDQVVADSIRHFEQLAGKPIAWAYFSNNWMNHIRFPNQEVQIILNDGKIPFIRMMPRSTFEENQADPIYSLQRIIDGDFDTELRQWFTEASQINSPLLVEFGTEVNGEWFPWNGSWNGAGETTGYGDPNFPDGPERFRDAYRHIIDLSRQAGATNITWFFHFDALELPAENWNRFENYYPGDQYIDWIGISVYGPFKKSEPYEDFDEILSRVYDRALQLTNKPLAILEFGVGELNN